MNVELRFSFERRTKMTKKEMLYEIISNTKLSGLNERDVQAIISKTSKGRMEEVYSHFASDKENALFYYCLLAQSTL